LQKNVIILLKLLNNLLKYNLTIDGHCFLAFSNSRVNIYTYNKNTKTQLKDVLHIVATLIYCTKKELVGGT